MPSFSAASNQLACGLSGIAGRENLDNSPTIWISRIPHPIVRSKLPPGRRMFAVMTSGKGCGVPIAALYVLVTGLLVRGSILRIVVPDLALIVRQYLADAGAQAARIFLWLQDFVHPGSRHSRDKLDSDRSR